MPAIRTLQNDPAAIDTFPAILSNTIIQQQKRELADLQRQQAQLCEKLGPRHPDMVKLGLPFLGMVPALFDKTTAMSAVAMRLIQELSARGVPRGLPRVVWTCRHTLFGVGVRDADYRARFSVRCDVDSYPVLMATCGFVYNRLDRILKRLIRGSDTVIDVGANIGFVSMLACSIADRRPGVTAHCFEPDPSVFPWLGAHRVLNQDRFTLVTNLMAVGDSAGEGTLTVSGRSGWSTLATEPDGGFSFLPKVASVSVPITTLDVYCDQLNLVPGLIKIDVEGYELRVLRGAANLLATRRPYLIAEVNPIRLEAAGTSPAELIDEISSQDYMLFHVDRRVSMESGRTSRRYWADLPSVVPGDLTVRTEFDVLGVPKERLVET